MPTWVIALFLTIGIAFALSACVISVQTRTDLSAAVARLSSSVSSMERAERLTPSQLVELNQLNDACAKANDLLKRINQREVMRDRRAAVVVDLPTGSKDELRRRAGLVAGRPAPHQ